MSQFNRILFLVVYLILLQWLSFRWAYSLGRNSRFSMFFDIETQTHDFETREKSSEAASLAYLKSKDTKPPRWSFLNSTVSDPFCITIVTKKRSMEAEYIIRSTAYLLNRLEALQYSNDHTLPIKVYITNTERPKTDHTALLTIGTAVDIIHLEDYVADYETRRFLNFDMETHLSFQPLTGRLDKYHIWLRNEALDTGLMMEYAEEIGCRYLLILEDDGIVSKDFYTRIQDALEEMDTLEYFSLKLFYSDTFSGWTKDPEDIFLLIVSTWCISAVFTVIPVFLLRSVGRIGKYSTVMLCTYLWIFYIGIFIAIGKQSIFLPYQGEGILKLGRHMGSTVGVVYPMKHFRGLSSFLRQKVMTMDTTPQKEWAGKGLKPMDLMIDDYADKVVNLDTYLLLPNVVQHIGRFSSTMARNRGLLKRLSLSNSFPKEDESF